MRLECLRSAGGTQLAAPSFFARRARCLGRTYQAALFFLGARQFCWRCEFKHAQPPNFGQLFFGPGFKHGQHPIFFWRAAVSPASAIFFTHAAGNYFLTCHFENKTFCRTRTLCRTHNAHPLAVKFDVSGPSIGSCLGQLVERGTVMPEVGRWNPTDGSCFLRGARGALAEPAEPPYFFWVRGNFVRGASLMTLHTVRFFGRLQVKCMCCAFLILSPTRANSHQTGNSQLYLPSPLQLCTRRCTHTN